MRSYGRVALYPGDSLLFQGEARPQEPVWRFPVAHTFVTAAPGERLYALATPSFGPAEAVLQQRQAVLEAIVA